jgi:hypothetical protein
MVAKELSDQADRSADVAATAVGRVSCVGDVRIPGQNMIIGQIAVGARDVRRVSAVCR